MDFHFFQKYLRVKAPYDVKKHDFFLFDVVKAFFRCEISTFQKIGNFRCEICTF